MRVNGGLQCSFRRDKRVQNIANYFDITMPYYILTAYGQISNDGMIFNIY